MSKGNEVVIILAKCGENHNTYGMRVENAGENEWLATWAFPVKESSVKREGYDKTTVNGNIAFLEEYPGCPFCGSKALTVCSCGHLNCTILKNGVFTCEWCGIQGQIGRYGGEGIIAGMDA